MLKLLVYGYSYGWKGSRKLVVSLANLLERAIHHNLSFIWLMGGLAPDHKTISEFRRKHKKALKEVMRQCARICIELDLIDGNVLFVDGTKIRANASRNKNHTREYYEKERGKIDKRIDELLEECERIDEEEGGRGSWVRYVRNTISNVLRMEKELADNEQYRNRIRGILNRFEEEEGREKKPETINQTDPESALMKGVQGSHASYLVHSS